MPLLHSESETIVVSFICPRLCVKIWKNWFWVVHLFYHLIALWRFDFNMIFLTSQQEQETSYTILRARGTNVTISSLKPDTTYVFQIRARTAAGYGTNSRKFEFETSPDCMYYFSVVYRGGAVVKVSDNSFSFSLNFNQVKIILNI